MGPITACLGHTWWSMPQTHGLTGRCGGLTKAGVLPKRGPQVFQATPIRAPSREECGPLKTKGLALNREFINVPLVLKFCEGKQVHRVSLSKLLDSVLPMRHGLPWLMSFRLEVIGEAKRPPSKLSLSESPCLGAGSSHCPKENSNHS